MSGSVTAAINCMSRHLSIKLDALLSAVLATAPLDYTTLFGQAITELQAVNANTDRLEQILSEIKTDTSAVTTNTANTVIELQNVIRELQGIDENTDNVEQILTDILTGLTTAKRYAYVALPERCVKIDGVAGYAVPVAVYDAVTNNHLSTEYKDSMGNPITGVVTVTDECDCGCKDCTPSCDVSIRFAGYDASRSIFIPGQTSEFEIIEDGVSKAFLAHDYATTADGTNVSTWYLPVTAAINALADWAIAVDTDVPATEGGKVIWKLTYTGKGARTLVIRKGVDKLIITVDENCSISGTSDDSGTGVPFASDPFDVPDPVPTIRGFDVTGALDQDTKVNYDDPSFTNAWLAIYSPWTANDLVGTLNANQSLAPAPYNTTLWQLSPTNPNVIQVVSGPVPSTIDFVSIPLSVPFVY